MLKKRKLVLFSKNILNDKKIKINFKLLTNSYKQLAYQKENAYFKNRLITTNKRLIKKLLKAILIINLKI